MVSKEVCFQIDRIVRVLAIRGSRPKLGYRSVQFPAQNGRPAHAGPSVRKITFRKN
jgi:hypothetical protein